MCSLCVQDVSTSCLFSKSLSKQLTYPFPGCSERNFCVSSDLLLSPITFGQKQPCDTIWWYSCITANQMSITTVFRSSRDVHQHPKDILIEHKPQHTWTDRQTHTRTLKHRFVSQHAAITHRNRWWSEGLREESGTEKSLNLAGKKIHSNSTATVYKPITLSGSGICVRTKTETYKHTLAYTVSECVLYI